MPTFLPNGPDIPLAFKDIRFNLKYRNTLTPTSLVVIAPSQTTLLTN